jgi:serine/threonine protein kinase
VTVEGRDRYELGREIGAGGMATVYLARDLKHDRKVALKVLNAELGAVIVAAANEKTWQLVFAQTWMADTRKRLAAARK